MVEEYPQDDTMKGFQNTILMNTLMVGLHQKEAKAAIEDLKLYIEALEEAYKQLDKTFEKTIFEPAKKEAEIMIKEQKELGRRTKPKFYS